MDYRAEDIVSRLACYWRTVLASAAVGAAAALAYALAAPATYRATSTMLVRPTQLFEIKSSENVQLPAEHERKINSLSALVRAEHFIQDAVRTVGALEIQPEPGALRLGERFWDLRRSLNLDGQALLPQDSNMETRAVRSASRSLHVSVEPKTNLIQVSFDHGDPRTAAAFVNALIAAVRKRISEQGARDDAASFLAEQMKSYNQAYERSLAKLAQFSERTSVYGLDDQRKMKLEREGTLQVELQQTSSAILEKKTQAAELSRLLESFFPVAKYPQMNELLKLGKDEHATRNAIPGRSRGELEDTRSPLLLVKVYQDTTQTLVKLHADVAGLRALHNQQVKDLDAVRKELRDFAHNSATFELMRMEASQAKQTAEQYKSFAIKEQVMAEAYRYGLSPAFEVLQTALPPQEPSFPKPLLMVVFGSIAGAALGVATAIARLKWSPRERQLRPTGDNSTDTLAYINGMSPARRSAPQG